MVSLCFDIWVLGSKIAIVLYVPGKWSVLFVSCAGGGIYYSDRTVCTGNVVSVVCSVCV